jgi:hypothetical protein
MRKLIASVSAAALFGFAQGAAQAQDRTCKFAEWGCWSTPNEVVRLEVWLCHRGGLQWRRSTSLKRSLRSCGRLMF